VAVENAALEKCGNKNMAIVETNEPEKAVEPILLRRSICDTE